MIFTTVEFQFEDLFYDLLFFDEGNDAHRAVAFGAGEGVYLPGSGPG